MHATSWISSLVLLFSSSQALADGDVGPLPATALGLTASAATRDDLNVPRRGRPVQLSSADLSGSVGKTALQFGRF